MSQYPIPSESDIAAKNKQLGFEIPKEYASFLSTFNAGRPEKRVFRQSQNPEGFPDFIVNYFLGIAIDGEDENYDLYSGYIDVAGEMPKGLLPIAYDSAENLLVIGIEKNNYGKVYILYASENPKYERYTEHPPELLCDSFNEFLNRLEVKSLNY